MASYPCPHCRGAGRLELTGVYARTLDLLRAQADEVTGAGLSLVADCGPTAMNNRLAALERKGLATSRRHGCRRLYRAAEPRRDP